MADTLPRPAALIVERDYASDKAPDDIERRNAPPLIPMRKRSMVREAVDMVLCPLTTGPFEAGAVG